MANRPDGRTPEQPSLQELMFRADVEMATGAKLIHTLRGNIAESRRLVERAQQLQEDEESERRWIRRVDA